MKKHTMLNLDEKLVKMMKKTSKLMGMTLSNWVEYIARDKIAYFLRNADKYMEAPDDYEQNLQWEKDIQETIEICKKLWHI